MLDRGLAHLTITGGCISLPPRDVPMKTRLSVSAFALSTWLLATASVVSGQYPGSFQVTKDGASIVIEDYATVPPSSLFDIATA